MLQLTLFDTKKYTKFEFPDYQKRYSVYAYDHTKFVKKYKKIKKLAQDEGNPDIYWSVNPYDIIEQCIIRNKDGTKKHLNDEKHIFRLKTLHRVYELLAQEVLKGQQLIPFDGCFIDLHKVRVTLNKYDDEIYEHKKVRGGFGKYRGERFIVVNAELQGSEMLPIYQRLKIHLNLLRELRNGLTIKQAVYKTRRKYGKWLKQLHGTK